MKQMESVHLIFKAGLNAYYELLVLVSNTEFFSLRSFPYEEDRAYQCCISGLSQIKEVLLIIHYDILHVISLFIITNLYN